MKSLLIKGTGGKGMYLSRSESLKAVLFMRFFKRKSQSIFGSCDINEQRIIREGGFINMHKDISGVLTVSTCLLNRDRNSVSDFREDPPPEPHVSFFTQRCLSLPVTVPLTTHTWKKNKTRKNTFSEMSTSGGSLGLKLLFGCLPF